MNNLFQCLPLIRIIQGQKVDPHAGLRTGGQRAKFQALVTSPSLSPPVPSQGPFLWASAEKAEAVSPPAGCLHLNRGLGRLKGPQGHTERFHGVSQALGANLSLVAFQKHTMQATVFFLLDDCTWSGLFSLLPHGTQGNKSSNNSPCSWKRPQVSKVDPSTSHLSLPEVGSVLVPHYG